MILASVTPGWPYGAVIVAAIFAGFAVCGLWEHVHDKKRSK